jgi:hypothetical protein
MILPHRARSPPPSSRSLDSSSASSEGGGAVSSPPPILSPETRSHYGLLQMVCFAMRVFQEQKISRAKRNNNKMSNILCDLRPCFCYKKYQVQETVICLKFVKNYKGRIQYVSIFLLFSRNFPANFYFCYFKGNTHTLIQ